MKVASDQHLSVAGKRSFGNLRSQIRAVKSNLPREWESRMLRSVARGKREMEVRDTVLRVIDIPDNAGGADVRLPYSRWMRRCQRSLKLTHPGSK